MLAMSGRCQNRKRVRPPGSADKVTIAERGSMRYTFHGGGPCDGALNGAVMPDSLSSGSAGQPLSAHAFAIRATAPGSVTRAASPSITTSASRIDTAIEHRGSRATLRPFRVPRPSGTRRSVEPQGTDRGHMRAAVLVDGGQPGGAGVQRVRSWCRPRSELLSNGGPIHRRQPIRLTQIDDLHKASLHCPGDILANSIWLIRRSMTAEVIAHTRVTSRPGARTYRQERASRGTTGRSAADNRTPELRWTLARISWRICVADQSSDHSCWRGSSPAAEGRSWWVSSALVESDEVQAEVPAAP